MARLSNLSSSKKSTCSFVDDHLSILIKNCIEHSDMNLQ
jgi:hypothetical protein